MNLKRLFASKPMLALEIGVILLLMFNVGKEMYKKHSIEEEIKRLEQEIGKLENNKSELGALLNYVRTDTFVEQEARSKLNLASPGESLVLMPDADTNPDSQGGAQEQVASGEITDQAEKVVAKKNNLALWWEYFFEHERLK